MNGSTKQKYMYLEKVQRILLPFCDLKRLFLLPGFETEDAPYFLAFFCSFLFFSRFNGQNKELSFAFKLISIS